MRREKALRWTFFIIGLIVLAFGITLTIKGKLLGIGPWDVFHYGLYLQLGLTIGRWSIIIGLLLLLITSMVTKTFPTIGAILNMILLGVFIDIFNYLLPNPESVAVQIILYILGIIILGYGIGLYVSAGLGAGPRDAIMLIIVEKTGWSTKWVRNGIEITVFLLGWLLGGPVGVGTVFIAFFLGPIIGLTIPQSKSLLVYLIQRDNKVESSVS